MKETRFKQTEIGLIPEDWEVYDIYKMGIFSKGAGISRNESMTGNIPAIRYGEIYTHHNNVVRNFNSWISTSVAAKSTKIKCNDLLFTASGETKEEIGKCVAYIYNHDAYAGGDIIILTPKNHYNSIFLGYLMNSQIICKQKTSKGQGDAVVHITANSLSKIKCPIPDIEEQNKIASALTSIDNLLLSLDKLIEKKRLIKQGAMQELLTGKKRLPGFTGEWIERRLGDMLTVKHGYPFKSEEYQRRGNFLIVTISNVQDGYFEWGVGNYIDNIPYNLQRHQKLEIGDILVSLTGNIGRICKVDRKNCLLNQRVGVLRFTNDKLIDFIYYRLHHTDFIYSLYAQSKGVAQQNIGSSEIEDFKFYMPSDINEVKAISSIIKKIEADIITIEKKRAKYEQIKQGMMQQLLTGKIRLI